MPVITNNVFFFTILFTDVILYAWNEAFFCFVNFSYVSNKDSVIVILFCKEILTNFDQCYIFFLPFYMLSLSDSAESDCWTAELNSLKIVLNKIANY